MTITETNQKNTSSTPRGGIDSGLFWSAILTLFAALIIMGWVHRGDMDDANRRIDDLEDDISLLKEVTIPDLDNVNANLRGHISHLELRLDNLSCRLDGGTPTPPPLNYSSGDMPAPCDISCRGAAPEDPLHICNLQD